MLQESSRWGLRVSVARHLIWLTLARWTSSEPSPSSLAGGRLRTRSVGGRRFSSARWHDGAVKATIAVVVAVVVLGTVWTLNRSPAPTPSVPIAGPAANSRVPQAIWIQRGGLHGYTPAERAARETPSP
jgi:hypothetical protein